jgi:hypothetical protein
MIQPATRIEQQAAGDKKINTYFHCDVSTIPLLLLMLQRGGWSFVVNEA